ncbi:MAG TPA: GNAT family N-acetyltransferase [Deltaproteobacteria bacterium]|nr:GNAT family N-acetyltransferase [Deltaproteobacteria bacterium]
MPKIRIEQIDKSRLLEIKEFIPEEFDQVAEKFDPETDITWAAINGDKTCGVVWGHQYEHNKENCFQIVLLKVLSQFRNQGIGTMLFQTAQEEAEKRSVQVIRTNFKGNDTLPVAEKILTKYGWKKPEATMYYCESTVDKFFKELSWTNPSRYASYESYIHPWSEITPEELETIRKTEGGYFAQNAESDLLWDKEKVEPVNSLVLRNGRTLMGWLVTHRHKPDTVHYTSIFIFDEHRGSALYRAASVKALCLQKEAGIPKSSWLASAKDKKVLKLWNMLYNRIMTKSDTWYQSEKIQP